jgi:hypothetical protein
MMSVCRVLRLLDAPHPDCKQWETARPVDATLEISRLAYIILEIIGKFQYSLWHI